ncbi:DUF6884 domain-containing protein [Roseofilum capinflatum]|uniref:DUF6884 domain-containing protein n=1 Tax=Roseofilum capinflatum BLCC-M114 TaxID=3022440 RepID=A0ABT7BCM6_9CYAN|nr:DUF6884 domain-containing protein [Roseofilum capinflatum]MDJ1176939.1 hypothetical protein [Roseofilum capinflatum BLCC-M114]
MTSRRLLILSCSQAKRSQAEALPALERYDGPAFRVVRRFLNQQPDPALDIYVLSGKFGLICSDRLIPNYDQKMTQARSLELNPSIVTHLEATLKVHDYHRLLICVTKKYLKALKGYSQIIPVSVDVTLATGTLGRKLSVLRQWLYGESLQFLEPVINEQTPATVYFKGVELKLADVNFSEVARQALAQGKGKPYNYQTWYILIDDQRISPKWLVSQLTGFPVSSFHSQAARRLLRQLGIPVYCDL